MGEETVTYAKARVDGELMVVRYAKIDDAQDSESSTTVPSHRIKMRIPQAEDEILRLLSQVILLRDCTTYLLPYSSVHISHPNLVQYYGRSTKGGSTTFTVMRAGA